MRCGRCVVLGEVGSENRRMIGELAGMLQQGFMKLGRQGQACVANVGGVRLPSDAGAILHCQHSTVEQNDRAGTRICLGTVSVPHCECAEPCPHRKMPTSRT